MAKLMQYKMKKISWWFFPLLVAAFAISAVTAAFVGRICTITCDRTQGTCHVYSKGFLYPVDNFTIPLNQIEGFQLIMVRSEGTSGRGGRPSIDHYSVRIKQGISQPLTILPDYDVQSYDILSGGDASAAAVDALQAFLANPAVPAVQVTFGTHMTGYAGTALIFIGLAFFFVRKGIWSMSINAERGSTLRRLVFDDEDSDEKIRRVMFETEVTSGGTHAWSNTVWMHEGSELEVGTHLVVHQPWGKTEKSHYPIPKLLPQKMKEELKAVAQAELQALSRGKNG